MHVADIERLIGWEQVIKQARATMGKITGAKREPTDAWKKAILLAEHSPIRLLTYAWRWEALKGWVSVHLVRHKIGVEHFVQSQRTDRRTDGKNRDKEPQDTPVIHDDVANAQSIINTSRRRLCRGATSLETRQAWQAMLTDLSQIEPMLAAVCVPECIYRGYCYELPQSKNGCTYSQTAAYAEALAQYRQIG